MKGSALPIWISVLVLALASYGGFLAWRTRAAQENSSRPLRPASMPAASGPKLTEFSLTERSGQTFHSRSLRGEVWVASVFFTACPSVCLELNQTLAHLQTDPRFADVKFVSITCDPRNDTPEVLAAYAQRFGADSKRWLFCTGALPYIEKIGRDLLGITVQGVTHSNRAVIFDREGKSRGGFVVSDKRLLADRLNFEKQLLECLAEARPGAEPIAEPTAAAVALPSSPNGEQP